MAAFIAVAGDCCWRATAPTPAPPRRRRCACSPHARLLACVVQDALESKGMSKVGVVSGSGRRCPDLQ